jgi:hypothetical protein
LCSGCAEGETLSQAGPASTFGSSLSTIHCKLLCNRVTAGSNLLTQSGVLAGRSGSMLAKSTRSGTRREEGKGGERVCEKSHETCANVIAPRFGCTWTYEFLLKLCVFRPEKSSDCYKNCAANIVSNGRVHAEPELTCDWTRNMNNTMNSGKQGKNRAALQTGCLGFLMEADEFDSPHPSH